MESKTYRTTSDVIVIYEANDTEKRRGTALGGRAAAVHSRLVNPKKHKHDMGAKGGAGPGPGPGGGIIGRKEGSREEKLHKFGDSILPLVSKRSKRKREGCY